MVLLAPAPTPTTAPPAPRGSRRASESNSLRSSRSSGTTPDRTHDPSTDTPSGRSVRHASQMVSQLRGRRFQLGVVALGAGCIVVLAVGAGIGGLGSGAAANGAAGVREIPFTPGAEPTTVGKQREGNMATPSVTTAPSLAPGVTVSSSAVTDALLASSAATPAVASSLVVHTAGAVLNPGVYVLARGARAADAVSAAGGMTPDADPDRVNLASLLADGSRLYIPRRGAQIPAVPTDQISVQSTGQLSNTATAAAAGTAVKQVIDLNTATAEQLDSLPGVGPATAAAIIEHRSRVGRFRSVNQLLDVPGIGEAKLASMRKQLSVS